MPMAGYHCLPLSSLDFLLYDEQEEAAAIANLTSTIERCGTLIVDYSDAPSFEAPYDRSLLDRLRAREIVENRSLEREAEVRAERKAASDRRFRAYREEQKREEGLTQAREQERLRKQERSSLQAKLEIEAWAASGKRLVEAARRAEQERAQRHAAHLKWLAGLYDENLKAIAETPGNFSYWRSRLGSAEDVARHFADRHQSLAERKR
jgi:hypothetical protein